MCCRIGAVLIVKPGLRGSEVSDLSKFNLKLFQVVRR